MLILPSSRGRKRLEIPHEPGQWIEIQRLAWSELPQRSVRTDPIGVMRDLFVASVVAWSYDAPVSLDHMLMLDDTTAGWLYDQINAYTHERPDQGNATAPSV